ncbi:MAG: phosphoribosylanthranilate isomerase [Pseudoxanthomonas sp.]
MSLTRIKFCGFTRAADLALAVELGVDYVGLVFAPRSARRLSPEQARALRAAVPETIGVVALLMDNPADEARAIVDAVQPDALQFHGGEDAAFCAGFGLPFWKAIAMGGQGVDALGEFARYPSASAFLLDGHGAGEPGGSGQSFDWTLAPQAVGKPVLLAGGLSPDNVGVAIRTARPWGVDVSSGIESAPGAKSAEKMRAFVDAVRRADAATAARIV